MSVIKKIVEYVKKDINTRLDQPSLVEKIIKNKKENKKEKK